MINRLRCQMSTARVPYTADYFGRIPARRQCGH